MIIFDSDVLIDILRGKASTKQQLDTLPANKSLCCSVITLGEIIAGMRPHEEKSTREFLLGFLKIPIDEHVADYAGRIKNMTKSHALSLPDCMIAATAILNDALLVTKNIKHYPLKELKIHAIR